MTDVGKPYSGGRTGNAGFGRPRTPELDARYDKKQRGLNPQAEDESQAGRPPGTHQSRPKVLTTNNKKDNANHEL